MGDFPQGITGALAVCKEAIPGTKPGGFPSEWVLCTSENLDVAVQVERYAVIGASRNAYRNRTTFEDAGGAINTYLSPNQCGPMLTAVLGMDTYLTAVTGDTVKTGNATTTNGITSIPLTTGAGTAYVKGRLVKIGSGATTEIRQVLSGTGGAGSGVITVAALMNAANLVAGIAVQQVAQHENAEIPPGTTTSTPTVDSNGLATLWVEANHANLPNSLLYPQTVVGKLETSFSEKLATCAWQLESWGPRSEGGRTSYAPSAADLLDAAAPFSGAETFVSAYSDPTGSGTGAVRLFQDWSTVKVTIDNTMKKTYQMGTKNMRKTPGARTIMAEMEYYDQSGRATPTEYKELIDSVNATDGLQPLGIMCAMNQGTAGTPVWAAVGIWLPQVKYLAAAIKNPSEDIIGVSVKVEAQPDAAGDPLGKINIINQTASAY